MIVRILIEVLQVYLLCVFVRVLLSWFPMDPWGRPAKAAHVLERITDPILVPLRRAIPPLRIGAGAIDLSPVIVLVGLEIVINILRSNA